MADLAISQELNPALVLGEPVYADVTRKVSGIVESGVVAPNGCAGKKIPDRLQVVAKPGEFVFFVRKLNAKEQFAQ